MTADRDSVRRKVLTSIKQRILLESAYGVESIPAGRDLVPPSSEVVPAPKPIAKTPQAKPSRPAREASKMANFSSYVSKLRATPFDSEPLPLEQRDAALEKVAAEAAACTACGVNPRRLNSVPGTGPVDARIMFVGEAPGADEDEQGVPFVGRAGQQLADIIEKGMKLPRANVFIVNVLKCRPPGNRTPSPEECHICGPFLERQIEIVRPQVICALGAVAAKYLLGLHPSTLLGSLRGTIHDYRGIPVIVTYHPSYLFRKPEAKKLVWIDIQKLMELLDNL